MCVKVFMLVWNFHRILLQDKQNVAERFWSEVDRLDVWVSCTRSSWQLHAELLHLIWEEFSSGCLEVLVPGPVGAGRGSLGLCLFWLMFLTWLTTMTWKQVSEDSRELSSPSRRHGGEKSCFSSIWNKQIVSEKSSSVWTFSAGAGLCQDRKWSVRQSERRSNKFRRNFLSLQLWSEGSDCRFRTGIQFSHDPGGLLQYLHEYKSILFVFKQLQETTSSFSSDLHFPVGEIISGFNWHVNPE